MEFRVSNLFVVRVNGNIERRIEKAAEGGETSSDDTHSVDAGQGVFLVAPC